MLSEKLKEETKQNHQLLEKKLVQRMRIIRTTQDYAKLLSLFYSYFGGLELLIAKNIDTGSLPDYFKRRKTTALADDIIYLCAEKPALAANNNLPEINGHLQALGALYVIEGSTLGGKIISKMISQQLNITDGMGLIFFNGYGDQTDMMWQSFKNSIDKASTNAEQQIVIASANETFLKFSAWFDCYFA